MRLKLDPPWSSDGCYHGPVKWRSWNPFSVRWVKIGVHPPSWGRRLIFYRPGTKPNNNPPSYFKGEVLNKCWSIGFIVDMRGKL